MTGFHGRLKTARFLNKTFADAFNTRCETHKIYKFGMQDSDADEAHGLIAAFQDPTAQLLRYAPDGFLADKKKTSSPVFVEFRTAGTGVREDAFFERLKANCPNMDPPFESKSDVFGMEHEALEVYRHLGTLGIRVVVVGHARHRYDHPIRAQYADIVATCNTYDPTQGAGTTGSGTIMENVNFASFVSVPQFFSDEFGVDQKVMQDIEEIVLKKIAIST